MHGRKCTNLPMRATVKTHREHPGSVKRFLWRVALPGPASLKLRRATLWQSRERPKSKALPRACPDTAPGTHPASAPPGTDSRLKPACPWHPTRASPSPLPLSLEGEGFSRRQARATGKPPRRPHPHPCPSPWRERGFRAGRRVQQESPPAGLTLTPAPLPGGRGVAAEEAGLLGLVPPAVSGIMSAPWAGTRNGRRRTIFARRGKRGSG